MNDKVAVLNTKGQTKDGGYQYVYALRPPMTFDNMPVPIFVVRVRDGQTLALANGDTVMQRYGRMLAPSEVLGDFGYEEGQ